MSLIFDIKDITRISKNTIEEDCNIEKLVDDLTQNNLKEAQDQYRLYFEKEESNHKKKQLYKIERADFDNGWWVHYSDNKPICQKFQTEKILFINHGLPGAPSDFNRLYKHQQNYCRIIVFCLPGFDNYTEIRGSYSGDRFDIAFLIKKLLDFLKIPKIILTMHSGSTVYSREFCFRYSERLEGVIELCPFCKGSFPIGLKTYWGTIVRESGVYDHKLDLNDSQTRESIHKAYLERIKHLHFDGIKFMPTSLFGNIAFIKLLKFFGEGPLEFDKYKRMPDNLLYCLIGTKDDVLIEKCHYIDYCYELFCCNKKLKDRLGLDELQYKNVKKIFGNDSENCGKLKGNVDNLQKHHLYVFETGGHQVFRKKAWECSLIIKKYVTSQQLIEQGVSAKPSL